MKPSIVAFTARFSAAREGQPPPPFPPIIGTGFIVDESGLVITNDHVLKAFKSVFRPRDLPANDSGVGALVFRYEQTGVQVLPVELSGFGVIGGYYRDGKPSERKPDVAVVKLKVRGLPAVKVGDAPVEEGMELATSGFGMGETALAPAGLIEQMGPTLQSGVVSAVLPFPQTLPEGFTLNVMVRGGASGSPVFHPDSGDVLGVLYGALKDVEMSLGAKPDPFQVPTNISYVVHGQILRTVLDRVKIDPRFHPEGGTPELSQLLKQTSRQIDFTGWKPNLRSVPGDQSKPTK